MNKLAVAFLASVASAAIAVPAVAADTSALEQNFDSMISATDQQQWLETMASKPNHVGSPHDKANADMTLALFKQWVWDAHIEQFDVLYPTPITTTLELITPGHVTLGGQEPPVVDGLTGAERFFLSWAQAWQIKVRDEEALRLLSIDPHSPNEFRCNQIVRNLDVFSDAFGLTPSDALWLAPDDRVTIW